MLLESETSVSIPYVTGTNLVVRAFLVKVETGRTVLHDIYVKTEQTKEAEKRKKQAKNKQTINKSKSKENKPKKSTTTKMQTHRHDKAKKSLIQTNDDKAGVVLAPASGSAV